MTVTTNACRGGWAREKDTFFFGDETPIWVDFQLAALRALLASLLSPGCVRPPHLAQGLDLFRKGKYFKPFLILLHYLLSPLFAQKWLLTSFGFEITFLVYGGIFVIEII